jgi:hypothetical protein
MMPTANMTGATRVEKTAKAEPGNADTIRGGFAGEPPKDISHIFL